MALGGDTTPGPEPTVASVGDGSQLQNTCDSAPGHALDVESLAVLRRFFEILDEWDRGETDTNNSRATVANSELISGGV